MSVYTVKQPAKGVHEIDDGRSCSLYIIEGTERALVIDTGMAEEDILEMIASVTDKPFELALTHGHGDHSMHCARFDRVYMDMADKELLYSMRFEGQKIPDEARLVHITGETKIDLGNAHICVIPLPGHTPGSVLFADRDRRCVFTGDAVGSGCGVWMVVPTALTLSEYAAALRSAAKALEEMGADDTWTYFGGHASQRYLSTVSGDNPVCLSLIKDMARLCEGLLSGEIAYTPIDPADPSSQFGAASFAKYGRAEMQFRTEQLR